MGALGDAPDTLEGGLDSRLAEVAPAVAPAVALAALAALEVLDRDGQPRQTFSVHGWPLRIGRAMDNDVLLADPHVAPHHFSITQCDQGLELHVGDSRNGMHFGTRHLRADERTVLPRDGAAIDLTAGRTRLRLRLPGQTLAPELALAVAAPLSRRIVPVVIAAALVLFGLLLRTWLDTDPDAFGRAAGTTLLGAVAAAALWCGAWALLSKTFTHQARFGWHLRVFLLASIASLAVNMLPGLVAFALSWPWLSDFAFVGIIGVAATALYFHLLAVEPARRRLLKWAAATCAAVGIGLTLWFNVQRTGEFGDELYMSHLFPPALRLARPVATDAFIDGLAPLKATLDKKARDTSRSDDAGDSEE